MSTVWSWILLFIVILIGCQRHLSGFVVFFELQKPCQHMGMAFGAAVHPDFRLFCLYGLRAQQ